MSGRDGRRRGGAARSECWGLAHAVTWALLAGACARSEAPTATRTALSASAVVEPAPPTAATDASADAILDGSAVTSGAPWPALVRDEQWDAAWRALETLPELERSRPELRYVRARVALARANAAAALTLLDGLDPALPLLADDIARRRAEAMLVAGPFAEAGAWFAARPSPAAQLDAARCFERAKDTRRTRAAAERVIASDKRTRAQEADARALRIRIADAVGDSERADARWLATSGADLPAAADALAVVARVDPAHPLTARELLERAHVLSDGGRLDDALHAIDLAAAAPGAATIGDRDRAHARGMALYQARGHWSEAAKTLAECAGAGGPNAAEDAFHAARALSRADRDDEAIRGYEDVERRYPTSKWAERAAFFVPYLRMLHGEWKDSARGFDAYLRAHPRGDEASDARRDGALCKLLAGDAKSARPIFERLIDDEGDATAKARMADMAALAALHDGDRSHAVARWTEVARTRPLTWPALVARARLAEAGAPVPPAMEPPEAAADPAPPLALAVPAPADMLHRLGLDADAESAMRDRETALAASAGPRAVEALCAAYGELGRARRRYQIAQSLPSTLFVAAPGPRTRWAWDCAFPAPYAEAVRSAESAEHLPAGLIWSIMRQESGFDPDALSAARAVGLMQLLPETARSIADELALPRDDARLTSPPYAIAVAARLLRRLLDQFHGSVPLAVAAYNGGGDSVERWRSRAPEMQIDTFVERIPFKETRDYVVRVMGNLARYGYMAGGEGGVPAIELELPR
jgi:soluble lytic murein transglycosylase